MTLTAKDIEYRRALGIADDEPLPNKLGQAMGHAHRPWRTEANAEGRIGAREHFYGSEMPTGPRDANGNPSVFVDAADVDRKLRKRRIAVSLRAVPRGDVDAQLDEYAEAIMYAEQARDDARTREQRLAASAYLNRLRDRRDALMRVPADARS